MKFPTQTIGSAERRLLFRNVNTPQFNPEKGGERMGGKENREQFEKRKDELLQRKDGVVKRIEKIQDKVANKRDWENYKQGFLKNVDRWNQNYDRIASGHREAFHRNLESIIRGYDYQVAARENGEKKTETTAPTGKLERVQGNAWSVEIPNGATIGFKFDSYVNWQYLQSNTVSMGDMRMNGFRISRDPQNKNRIIVESNLPFSYALNGIVQGSTNEKPAVAQPKPKQAEPVKKPDVKPEGVAVKSEQDSAKVKTEKDEKEAALKKAQQEAKEEADAAKAKAEAEAKAKEEADAAKAKAEAEAKAKEEADAAKAKAEAEAKAKEEADAAKAKAEAEAKAKEEADAAKAKAEAEAKAKEEADAAKAKAEAEAKAKEEADAAKAKAEAEAKAKEEADAAKAKAEAEAKAKEEADAAKAKAEAEAKAKEEADAAKAKRQEPKKPDEAKPVAPKKPEETKKETPKPSEEKIDGEAALRRKAETEAKNTETMKAEQLKLLQEYSALSREELIAKMTPEFIDQHEKNGTLHILFMAIDSKVPGEQKPNQEKQKEMINDFLQQGKVLKQEIEKAKSLSVDQIKAELMGIPYGSYFIQGGQMKRAIFDVNNLEEEQLRTLYEVCILEKQVRAAKITYDGSAANAFDPKNRVADCNTTANFYKALVTLSGSPRLLGAVGLITTQGHAQLCLDIGKDKNGKPLRLSKNTSYVDPSTIDRRTGKNLNMESSGYPYPHNFYDFAQDQEKDGIASNTDPNKASRFIGSELSETRSGKKLSECSASELKEDLKLLKKVLELNPHDPTSCSNVLKILSTLKERNEIDDATLKKEMGDLIKTYVEATYYSAFAIATFYNTFGRKETAPFIALYEQKILANPQAFKDSMLAPLLEKEVDETDLINRRNILSLIYQISQNPEVEKMCKDLFNRLPKSDSEKKTST